MTEAGTTGLAGLKVGEWGVGRAGSYAGRLLADFGADVVLIEHDGGEREAAVAVGPQPAQERQLEARIRFLHGGKRSVLVDITAAAERERLLRFIETLDVLVIDRHLAELDDAGLSPESIAERFPRLVVVVITLAGLGAAGRYLHRTDLVGAALSGVAYGTGAPVPTLEEPPLRPGGYQAEYTTGLTAASGALVGLQLRRRTGSGQLIDVSTQATLASFMRMAMTYAIYGAADTMNLGIGSRLARDGKRSTLWGLVPCKDGYFAFQASEQWQWDGLMKMMGYPEWSKNPRFAEPLDRAARWNEIEPHFVGWCMEHSKTEIFHTAQGNHVPVFPCYNVEELLTDPQQVARGFFVEIPAGAPPLVRVPGAILHLDRSPWRHDNGAPAPGQHTAEILGAFATGGPA